MTSLINEQCLHTGLAELFWQVHKFGGTSVADADCYRNVAKIVEEQLEIDKKNGTNDSTYKSEIRLAVVVSAMGGKPKTTDLLLDSVKYAADRNEDEVDKILNIILAKHRLCIEALFSNGEENSECTRLINIIQQDLIGIRDILKTVSLLKWQATRISEVVSGYGELWSAQILTVLLSIRQKNRQQKESNDLNHPIVEFVYLDARRVITIDEDSSQQGSVEWEVSLEKLKMVYEEESTTRKNVIIHFVMTGYVAVNTLGVATTLQRDGSDYSAAIIGRLLTANSISIWTDVDGVMSADPRRVPLAQVLPEVSFSEAMELSYFGAKVIHPKTMQPAIQSNPQIPIYIRNTFNPTFRGSRIYSNSTSISNRDQVVCGFSSIENIAVINVEGSGMIGVPGVSSRLFGTLERVGVNIILISQASSEHSVTFATTCEHGTRAKVALEEEFRRELDQGFLSNIDVKSPCSIIAAVGDGMAQAAGCSGRFFSALGGAKINIVAIAQGCSERNISAVVRMEESSRALRAVHAAFRLSHTIIRIGVIGINNLGISLLRLLEQERMSLRTTFDIDLQVCAVLPLKNEKDDILICLKNDKDGCTDSITMGAVEDVERTDLDGGSRTSFIDESCAKQVTGGPESILDIVFRSECTNHVIFDCTNFESVATFHAEWLRATVDVVSANNTALSGPASRRDEISAAERLYGKESASYLREVTVGGGLPVIKTLRSLLQTGDKIRRVDGIFSVSMSYILFRISPPRDVAIHSQYDEDCDIGKPNGSLTQQQITNPCSFSEAVNEAIGLGLMEEDFSKDLNNEYTCRILMVLARELGMDRHIQLNELIEQSETLLGVILEENVQSDFLSSEIDMKVEERVRLARSRGCVLRHVASIDVRSRKIDIKIVEVPDHHIFAVTPPSCECFRLFTKRHEGHPLVIQGPSAGIDSTASALLAELIHLMRGKANPSTAILARSASGANLRGSVNGNKSDAPQYQ